MKKIFFLSVVILLFIQISKAQEKTVIGLTNDEVGTLQRNNPDFKIRLNNYSDVVPQYFNSLAEAQSYIDSLKNVIHDQINTSEQVLPISSPNGRFAECGCGDYYATNTGSAGMFSNFNLSFSYCNGSVSNGNIGSSGLQIGWSLGSTSSSYNGLYACSTTTATFGIGILSWTQTIHIAWHFNPNTCSLYYNLGGGPCGGMVGV